MEEKIQRYIQDEAVPVQSNTAQRGVNVPLEEKLAETGLDSPPPSSFKPYSSFLIDARYSRLRRLLIGPNTDQQQRFKSELPRDWLCLTPVNISGALFVFAAICFSNKAKMSGNIPLDWLSDAYFTAWIRLMWSNVTNDVRDRDLFRLRVNSLAGERESVHQQHMREGCAPPNKPFVLKDVKWRRDNEYSCLCFCVSPSTCSKKWLQWKEPRSLPVVCGSHFRDRQRFLISPPQGQFWLLSVVTRNQTKFKFN